MDTREGSNIIYKIVKVFITIVYYILIVLVMPFLWLFVCILNRLFKNFPEIPEDLDSQRNPENKQKKSNDSTLQE